MYIPIHMYMCIYVCIYVYIYISLSLSLSLSHVPMLPETVFLEHELYYGLGMDALVTVCWWNANVIMVWAWMLR